MDQTLFITTIVLFVVFAVPFVVGPLLFYLFRKKKIAKARNQWLLMTYYAMAVIVFIDASISAFEDISAAYPTKTALLRIIPFYVGVIGYINCILWNMARINAVYATDG
jgi:hypothetical protein